MSTDDNLVTDDNTAMRDNQVSPKTILDGTTVSNYHYKAVSACAGAIITSLLVTPLDVVKTRLQSQPTTRAKAHKSSTCTTTKCHTYFERGLSKESAYRYNHTACQCPPRSPSANLSSMHESSLSWFASTARMSSASGVTRPINGTWVSFTMEHNNIYLYSNVAIMIGWFIDDYTPRRCTYTMAWISAYFVSWSMLYTTSLLIYC
jgi:hypothetical protein